MENLTIPLDLFVMSIWGGAHKKTFWRGKLIGCEPSACHSQSRPIIILLVSALLFLLVRGTWHHPHHQCYKVFNIASQESKKAFSANNASFSKNRLSKANGQSKDVTLFVSKNIIREVKSYSNGVQAKNKKKKIGPRQNRNHPANTKTQELLGQKGSRETSTQKEG